MHLRALIVERKREGRGHALRVVLAIETVGGVVVLLEIPFGSL